MVIAHGNSKVIGNASGSPTISPSDFLDLISNNMANGAIPEAIYISSCSEGLALFSAQVSNCIDKSLQSYRKTKIYGHDSHVSGPIPPSNQSNFWTQSYPNVR